MAKHNYEIAVIMLHPGCNMTCMFCISENSMDCMSFNDAVRAIDTARSHGVRNVVFGGGEPFAWAHDLMALARYAKSLELIVQVGTNGVDLPRGYEHAEDIDRYVLPLDSADADLHNTLRQYGDGHHELVMNRLEVLRASGRTVTVSTVVTSQNWAHLSDLGRFLNDYAADGGQLHAWHLYKFIPEGRGGRANADALYIRESVYKATTSHVRAQYPHLTIYKRKDMFHSSTVDFYWQEDGVLKTPGGQVFSFLRSDD